jgi:hypothetical protein
MGFAEGAILEDVNPGKITVDLGDGYKMSFTLSDAVESYDIETSFTESVNSYDVYIRPSDSDEHLLDLMFFAYDTPQFFPRYEKIERYGPITENDGPSVTMPSSIDGDEGHVSYSYPANDPGTNPDLATSAGFKYYPDAQPSGDDLKGKYEIVGDIMGAALRDKRAIPVFQEVIKTIHVSGL